MSQPNKCSCGSGEYPYPMVDGYGIFLCYACSVCELDKIRMFRHDIFERYECDEPIEAED